MSDIKKLNANWNDAERACGSCKHYFAASEEEGECRKHPPRAFMFPAVNHVTQRQAMQPFSAFPPTAPERFCGEHVLKLEADQTLN